MRTLLLVSTLLVTALAPSLGTAATHPERTAIRHPTAAAKVVLQVFVGGGFVAPSSRLREMPSFTLYGDGTVIVPGVVTQVYPGPAIVPLVTGKISERTVQALLTRAQRAGLLARRPIDYGDMSDIGITDMPSTVLRVNAGGRQVTRVAYALGADAHGGGLSASQAQARRALATFIAALPQRAARTPFIPKRLVVYVAPFSGQAQSGAKRIAWPLGSNLATAGTPSQAASEYRCILVGGKDVKTLLATFRRANEQSRWIARAGGSKNFAVVARPQLPDESRICA